MESTILPYLEISKQNVKRKISSLLTNQTTKEVANTAFRFHFKDKGSLAFQTYYCETISNREGFLSAPNFFRTFKQKYALQGIDGTHLDRLDQQKEILLQLIEDTNLAKLYFEFFAGVSLQHAKSIRHKTLGSFFAKFVHTFRPDIYCALDNPIKDYFGLSRESFYVAFLVISSAYQEWISENPYMMEQIRMELDNNQAGRSFSKKMSDLKLLDLIFWYQANKAQ